VGIVRPDAVPEARVRLEAFLAAGAQGDMGWMAAAPERRADPRILWPEVRAIVMLGLNYGPDDDPLTTLARRDRGSIAVYARGSDYHDLVKG
jgi:epoxyqueuosine reductase